MSRECEGLVGRFFGHRFRARYSTSTKAPDWIERAMERAAGKVRISAAALEQMERVATYEGDVCERCGCQVGPEPKPKGEA
jgi:hypothetical protein